MNPGQPFRLGILRESKKPHDLRAPMVPEDCRALMQAFPGTEIRVQPSPFRCYEDSQYRDAGCILQEDLLGCNLILGVKEVALDQLLPDHAFAFFSHTIKAQPYNQALMRHMVRNRITLHDYELMTDESGQRTVAFGYWAGIVGAWHGLRMRGLRSGTYTWPKALETGSYQALQNILQTETALIANRDGSPYRVLVCGSGRVGQGAVKVLEDAGFMALDPQDFLNSHSNSTGSKPLLYTVLRSKDLFRAKDGSPYSSQAFYTHPQDFETCIGPYLGAADLMINTIYWNPDAPRYFEPAFIQHSTFNIQQIADISCDIEGSVPLTHRPTTIEDPYYGISKGTLLECPPFDPNCVDIMAVDNLPCELPADASRDFSASLLRHFLKPLIKDPSSMPGNSLLLNQGRLHPNFHHLQEYAGIA